MTENVWKTEAGKEWLRHPQSHWRIAQIACHSTLQAILFALIMCLLTVGFVSADYQAGAEAYEQGDYETALQELAPLAEEGNPKAQFHLGQMYAKGNGVPHNDEEAAELYKKAAEQGDSGSQYRLGMMYENGEGVAQDYVASYIWYHLASQGHEFESARKHRNRVAEKMTPAQIAEAQRRAREWKPKKTN